MQLNLFHLIAIFIAEVLVLYKLSHILIQQIGRKLATLTHSKKITMYVLALLFLPGTILHELSHWIVARLVMVPTGAVTLWPSIEPEGFRLGSVAIAKTDVLRRFIIGAAPFLVGATVMISMLWFITSKSDTLWWHYLIVGYGVFEIGNTMFSSKKDLEGSSMAIIFLAAIGVGLYLWGVAIPAHYALQLQQALETAVVFVFIPIVIDLALVLFSKVL